MEASPGIELGRKDLHRRLFDEFAKPLQATG
jgi:hypothetical protein